MKFPGNGTTVDQDRFVNRNPLKSHLRPAVAIAGFEKNLFLSDPESIFTCRIEKSVGDGKFSGERIIPGKLHGSARRAHRDRRSAGDYAGNSDFLATTCRGNNYRSRRIDEIIFALCHSIGNFTQLQRCGYAHRSGAGSMHFTPAHNGNDLFTGQGDSGRRSKCKRRNLESIDIVDE